MDFFNNLFSNLWNVMAFFFWTFAFVAYLFALFAVVADLFRDRDLHGGWKAVWLVFLVFVPFLAVIVYLLARGRGMADRSYESARANEAANAKYIQSVASGTSSAGEIAKAKELLDAGAITPAEFARLKANALGDTTSGSQASHREDAFSGR